MWDEASLGQDMEVKDDEMKHGDVQGKDKSHLSGSRFSGGTAGRMERERSGAASFQTDKDK